MLAARLSWSKAFWEAWKGFFKPVTRLGLPMSYSASLHSGSRGHDLAFGSSAIWTEVRVMSHWHFMGETVHGGGLGVHGLFLYPPHNFAVKLL